MQKRISRSLWTWDSESILIFWMNSAIRVSTTFGSALNTSSKYWLAAFSVSYCYEVPACLGNNLEIWPIRLLTCLQSSLWLFEFTWFWSISIVRVSLALVKWAFSRTVSMRALIFSSSPYVYWLPGDWAASDWIVKLLLSSCSWIGLKTFSKKYLTSERKNLFPTVKMRSRSHAS